jgi:hypothetical protein
MRALFLSFQATCLLEVAQCSKRVCCRSFIGPYPSASLDKNGYVICKYYTNLAVINQALFYESTLKHFSYCMNLLFIYIFSTVNKIFGKSFTMYLFHDMVTIIT